MLSHPGSPFHLSLRGRVSQLIPEQLAWLLCQASSLDPVSLPSRLGMWEGRCGHLTHLSSGDLNSASPEFDVRALPTKLTLQALFSIVLRGKENKETLFLQSRDERIFRLLRTRGSSVLNICKCLTLANRILALKEFLNDGEGSDSRYFKLCRPCGPPLHGSSSSLHLQC